ncbi:MAG: phosphoribosylamine--glycine ligase [Pseudomonadota bacterium]
MRILVIGSGGREHAIAWKLQQSPKVEKVSVAPGNGGTRNNVALDIADHAAVTAWCQDDGVDLVIIGPEAPLVNGLADDLRAAGLRVFGPGRDGARLEGSKIFAKEFMQRHGVATAAFRAFTSPGEAREFAESFPDAVVVKYDGLAAGKGVFVCPTLLEALEALTEVERRYGADAPVVVEEHLIGREISILGFTDGAHIWLLTPSQDHKQLLDGDRGPNTGGMGAFCPVPFYDQDLADRVDEDIVGPTLQGLQADGIDFRGVLYFGIMLTGTGPKLLEYNVRLGDPETEVVLPALESDLLDLILACTDGGVDVDDLKLRFSDSAFVGVVLASGGYPGDCRTGDEITGLDAVAEDTLVFHAGTKRKGDRVVTNGGRVLNIVCRGDSIEEAVGRVYEELEAIHFEGRIFRTDIGRRGDGR